MTEDPSYSGYDREQLTSKDAVRPADDHLTCEQIRNELNSLALRDERLRQADVRMRMG